MKPKLFMSIRGHKRSAGGGANTFAWNMARFLKKYKLQFTSNIKKASYAIVIADKVDLRDLKFANSRGCFILHRLDEEFEPNLLKPKHRKIIEINKHVNVTIFQSEFVFKNVQPYLNARKWEIVLNGADPDIFCYNSNQGGYIGHISNSIGQKKRFDLLDRTITNYPQESFLLVGNHGRHESIDFLRHKNVTLVGTVKKTVLSKYHKKMKCLYFPSERDPCPNTVVEAILSGIPVCYNAYGGTKEVVKDCGLPLEQFDELLDKLPTFHEKCRNRKDLFFDAVAEKYLNMMGFV